MKIVHRLVAVLAVALISPTSGNDKPSENKIHSTTETSEKQVETTTEIPSTVSNEIDSSTTEKNAESERCRAMIGKFINGKFDGLEVTYDVMKVLEQHGGSPGRVNIKWKGRGDAPIDNPYERPLPDADPKFWIYDYRDSDDKANRYVRTEHAISRFSGNPGKAFLEYRGMILWTPEDFCGKARRANYIYDDRGFSFDVTREYCTINQSTYKCDWPENCRTVLKNETSTDFDALECGDDEESSPLLSEESS